MKYLIFKKAFVKPLVLAALSVMLLANVATAGGDSYTIYLNNKLVMKQYVTQPLSISSLQLDNATGDDVLVVYYSHCGTIGKGRSITVKNEHGDVLKEWKFADVAGKDNGMQIPVKDIIALQKKSGNISLYYASEQLPSGRMLTSLGKHDKTTAALWPLHVLTGRVL